MTYASVPAVPYFLTSAMEILPYVEGSHTSNGFFFSSSAFASSAAHRVVRPRPESTAVAAQAPTAKAAAPSREPSVLAGVITSLVASTGRLLGCRSAEVVRVTPPLEDEVKVEWGALHTKAAGKANINARAHTSPTASSRSLPGPRVIKLLDAIPPCHWTRW